MSFFTAGGMDFDEKGRRIRGKSGHFLIRSIINRTRARADKENMAFDLHRYVEHLRRRLKEGVCELTGVPFDFEGRKSARSPSIDRIDSTKGYTLYNIRFVALAANMALNKWPESTVFEVMRSWVRKVEAQEHSDFHRKTPTRFDWSKGWSRRTHVDIGPYDHGY